MAKFYHKAAFSTSVSTFTEDINSENFTTWTNLTDYIIEKKLSKTTATIKFHLDQFYQNIQSTKNFKPPELSIINKYYDIEPIIKGQHI